MKTKIPDQFPRKPKEDDWRKRIDEMVSAAVEEGKRESSLSAMRGIYEPMVLWYHPRPDGALALTRKDKDMPTGWLNSGLEIAANVPYDRYWQIVREGCSRLPIL
jgi:hypothetical protein